MKLNTMKTIEQFRGKINPRYDIGCSDLKVLSENIPGRYELISDSFVLGYAQGYKAKAAELRREGGEHETYNN